MVDSVFMAELSWPEWQARIAANVPVLLPVGSTEQHGPHLPLGVDVFLPTAVAERIARAVGGIVAPTVTYGYKSQPRSGGGQAFPGTTSLCLTTMVLVMRDIIHDLGLHGVRRLAVINGHYENTPAIVEGIDLAVRELKRDGVAGISVIRLDYWDFVRRETLDRLFPSGFPGIDLEHASLLETSLMLLVRPQLVEMEKVPSDGPAKFPTYDRTPVPPNLVPASGVLAVAHGSTADNGQLLMDDYVALISVALRAEFAL
jgi:creatinine amidohydrolase